MGGSLSIPPGGGPRPPFGSAYRIFSCSSPILCRRAGVGGSPAFAAPFWGCPSAHLVGVPPNFRLPPVPQCGERSNAAISHAVCRRETSLAPHDSKARLLSDHDSQGFMAKPCTPHPHCAARAALQATNPQWRGSRGRPLAFSLGGKGIFSHVREYPPYPQPHTVWGKAAASSGCSPLPRHARKKERTSLSRSPLFFTYFLLCRSNYSASCIAFAAATAFACASAEHCS